jgi:hypothetical protein
MRIGNTRKHNIYATRRGGLGVRFLANECNKVTQVRSDTRKGKRSGDHLTIT